jgi:hypothetical protein
MPVKSYGKGNYGFADLGEQALIKRHQDGDKTVIVCPHCEHLVDLQGVK